MLMTSVYMVIDEETGTIVGDALVITSEFPAREAKEHFKGDLRNPACALYVRVGGQPDFEAQSWNKEKK